VPRITPLFGHSVSYAGRIISLASDWTSNILHGYSLFFEICLEASASEGVLGPVLSRTRSFMEVDAKLAKLEVH
jgi:hypothetical protein